jgi:hypothetical protein
MCYVLNSSFLGQANFFGAENIGSKRDEVMGDWRKLHNEELHNLYSLPSVIRMIK